MADLMKVMKSKQKNIRNVRSRIPPKVIASIKKLGTEPREYSWKDIADGVFIACGVKVTQDTVSSIARGR